MGNLWNGLTATTVLLSFGYVNIDINIAIEV